MVEATRKGKGVARRANEVLSTPPAGLSALSTKDLEAVRRTLASVSREN